LAATASAFFGHAPTLSDWYPDRLKVELLHQNGPRANPLGDDFNYAEAFNKIDFAALKQDIKAFLTSSFRGGRPTMAITARR